VLETLALLVMLCLVVPCVPICLYLSALTVASPFGLLRRPRHVAPALRFGILVPAHDEAAVVGRLLSSISTLDYPDDLVRTVVVADNCSDGTAAIAAEAGALALERRDSERRGKGWALSWALEQLRRTEFDCDAYVLVDADSVLSTNFLTIMNDYVLAGADIVQGYYGVLPLRWTSTESLREASLALVHFLRPAAKSAFGVSCGLKGTGMAFRRAVLDRLGWPARGLAEDVEFHLALVAAGLRVTFAPDAVVRAEMPASLAAAKSQNRRWEAGRLATVAGLAMPLLRTGIGRRSLAEVDAAIEQLVPPLSVPLILLSACLIAGVAAHLPQIWIASLIMLVLLALHLAMGLMLARVPGRVYRSLAAAPAYVLWKAALYGCLLIKGHDRDWVRTTREALD